MVRGGYAGRRRTTFFGFLIALIALLLTVASPAGAAVGDLTHPLGLQGCITEPAAEGCTDGRALDWAYDITVSPDGRSAYAASNEDGAGAGANGLVVFARDPASGALTQKAGSAGCVRQTGSGGTCGAGRALRGARAVTVSPDGKSVYVASEISDGVAIFDRKTDVAPTDPAYGTVTQKAGTAGCFVASDGATETCAQAVGLGLGDVTIGAQDVIVSPDGRNVYLGGTTRLIPLDRAASGALTQKAGAAGCISSGEEEDNCVQARGATLQALAISPDGRSVYSVREGPTWLFVFDRRTDVDPSDPAFGTLSEKPGAAGCFSDPDNAGDTSCEPFRTGEFFGFGSGVVVSPDNRHVYATSAFNNSVVAFDRSVTTGALAAKSGAGACVSEIAASCQGVHALEDPRALAISPDGRSVYVTALFSEGLAVFDRDSASGALDQKSDPQGCMLHDGGGNTCLDGRALTDPRSVTVSPDGRNVYTAASASDGVAVFNREAPPPPTVSVGDSAPQTEGNSGQKAFSFEVSLSSPAPAGGATVDYATADGSATAPADYAGASGQVTFAPGETLKTVTVQANGDTAVEPDEDFFLNLSNPQGATVADAQGKGTIQNDDTAPPSLSVGDVTKAEGDAGTTAFDFTVTLSAPAPAGGVSASYATGNGSASAGSDFTAASGTVTFAAGESQKTVTVQVAGDTAVEPDEDFFLNLSSPQGATLSDEQGKGTIQNDDLVTASIGDVSRREGNTGTSPFSFEVTLSAPAPAGGASVQWATGPYNDDLFGSATPGLDFTTATGTLSFAPGETRKTVTVQVTGDTTPEPNEGFRVVLSNPQRAAIADGAGFGTIENDDGVTASPSASVGDVAGAEGSAGTTAFSFKIVLSSGAPTGGASVAYATANGSATAGSDFASASGVASFAAGETEKTVTVNVTGDRTFEADEAFTVNLSSPLGVTIADGQATGTIRNDDPRPIVDPPPTPSLSIGDVSGSEPRSGTASYTFTVSLSSSAPAGGVRVSYSTQDGTAAAPGDYTSASGTVAFAPGERQKTASVPVRADTLREPPESFRVNLTNSQGAIISDGQGQGTIFEDLVGIGRPGAPRPPSIPFSLSACGGGFCTVVPRTASISSSGRIGPFSVGYFGAGAARAAAAPRTLRIPARANDCRVEIDLSVSARAYTRFDRRLRRRLFTDPTYRAPRAISAVRAKGTRRTGNLTLARSQVTVPFGARRRVSLRLGRKGRALLRASRRRGRRGRFRATLRVALVCSGNTAVSTRKRALTLRVRR